TVRPAARRGPAGPARSSGYRRPAAPGPADATWCTRSGSRAAAPPGACPHDRDDEGPAPPQVVRGPQASGRGRTQSSFFSSAGAPGSVDSTGASAAFSSFAGFSSDAADFSVAFVASLTTACFGLTGSVTSSMTAMGALSPLRLP